MRESAKKSKRFQINFTQMFRARSATTFCGSSAFFMVTHSRDFIFIFTIIYAKFFSAQCFCFKSPKESWLFKVVIPYHTLFHAFHRNFSIPVCGFRFVELGVFPKVHNPLQLKFNMPLTSMTHPTLQSFDSPTN